MKDAALVALGATVILVAAITGSWTGYWFISGMAFGAAATMFGVEIEERTRR